MQVRTTREAAEFLDLIDNLKNSLFHTDLTLFRKMLQNNAVLSSYLQAEELSNNSRDVLLTYLDRKRAEILLMPRVNIVMAINPESSFLEKMCAWFSDNTGKPVLLDVTVNTGIVGGLLITYNGLYRDYSLKTKMEKYFNKFSNIHDLLRL